MSLNKRLTTLNLPARTCNEESYNKFDISQFTNVKTLFIGDYSFNSVKVFHLENLSHLRNVLIGKNCFMSVENLDSKCFRIANCPHLASFIVQEWSFVNCSGVIDISKLRGLKVIQIGSKEKDSHNFTSASLKLHGLSIFLSEK